MFITICKSKIANAVVTQTELYYQGSITIDEKIIKAVDIIPGEKVDVLNINNGVRIETFVIAGKSGSGAICLNGPAARSGCVGDKLIILSYGFAEHKEAKDIRLKIIELDDRNHIKN